MSGTINTDDDYRGLLGTASTMRQLVSRAKSALEGLDPQWIRAWISDFSPSVSPDYCRLVIHPIGPDDEDSNGRRNATWAARLWRNDASRLQPFLERASSERLGFDALVRVDLSARSGLVLVIEGVRI